MGPFLLLVLVFLRDCVATHFAYGTMSWQTTGRNTAGQMQVMIIQQYAWRRNYAKQYWSYTPQYQSNCSLKYDPFVNGCPLTTLDLGMNWYIYNRTSKTTYASTALVSQNIDKFYVMQESTAYLALSSTSDVNWIRGIYLFSWTVPSDTAEYVVVYQSAARLSTLVDSNKDQSWQMSCNIKIYDTFYRSRSPSTEGSIREYLESCVESGFSTPRLQSDGQTANVYPSIGPCNLTKPTSPYSTVYLPQSCLVKTLPSLVCPSFPAAKLGTDGKLTWYPPAPNQALCSVATNNTDCQTRYTSNKVGCFWDTFSKVCQKRDEYAVQFTLLEVAPTSLFTTYDVIFEVSQYCNVTDTTCNHAPHFSPRFTGPYYSTPNTPVNASYHWSVCGNPNATSCPCLRGVEASLTIHAVDYDTTQTVSTSNSLLPYGASLSSGTFLGVTRDPYDSNIPKSWTTYVLKWIPPIDGVDATVCFQALDSQAKPSNGNYCLVLHIVEAEYIYVSGTVRDFMASHPDFARPESLADNGAQWVQSALNNGKPAQNTSVTLSTVSRFDQWFNSVQGVNKDTVFSTTLVRLSTEDRFTYGNTNFLPINGILFGNDNTQGYPARGAINSFFTYEMHTYLVYDATSNVPYTFGSTDDMWLFINGVLVPGWTLHGLHPAKYQTVDLKALYAAGNPLGFVNDTTLYRVDLFYADRSANRTSPFIQMQLPKAVLCDALSSGNLEMSFNFNGTNTALNGTNLYKIGATVATTKGYCLLNQSQTAAAVYMADNTQPTPVPIPLKVLQGFQATFDFRILSPVTQGFAFVISSQNSVGSAGNQIGYGGISNILVVEFDTNYDATNGDPNYDHIAVLGPKYNSSTGFSGLQLTSNHTAYGLGISLYSPSNPEFGPLLTLTNGSSHRVRITYAPPQQGDTSAYKQGWLRVWINKVIKPVVEVPIPAVFLGQMLGSAAYVGFTAGSGSETAGKVFIDNLQIIVVPPSPTNTGVVNWVTSVIAGVVTTVTIQARDSCGNNILVGADQDRFGAEIRVISSGRLLTTEVTATFTTNNDGTYNFIYSCTRAGQYVVTLTFDNVEILGSQAVLIVNPAPTSRTLTQFAFGALPVALDNSLGLPVPGLYMIAVARDGTILSRVQLNNPSAILAWLTTFSAGTIFGFVNIGFYTGSSTQLVSKFNSIGCSNFSALNASESSWACISNGTLSGGTQAFRASEPVDQISRNFGSFVVVAQSDVLQSQGYLNVMQTADTTLIFFASASDTPTTVSVIARDQYGNLGSNGNDQFTISFSPVMTGGSSPLVPVAGSPGYYTASLSTTSASTYTMSIVLLSAVGSGNIYSIPAPLTFLAGPASYLTSTASGSGLSSSQAGTMSQFSVQLIDAFGNQIRDTTNALKNSVVVYFVNVADSGVVVNCTQNWSSAASELEVSYTPIILGTYNVVLVINGNSSVFVAGRQMLVVAGPPSPPNCTYSDASDSLARAASSVALSNAVAGVQTCIWVQSRDQFGNPRNSPADVFTFRLIGAVKNIINSSYIGGGIYVHCFTPTLAPASVNVVILFGSVLVGRPALNQTISVSVGSPSTNSVLPALPINITAGVPSDVQVACLDSENNIIANCDPTRFSFTLFTSTGIPTTLSGAARPTNSVTIIAQANITGAYTLQVRVNSQQIANSPLGVTVNPGPTDSRLFGRSTPPSGQGAFGGVRGLNTTFYIQCADQFGNFQNNYNDVIVVKIDNGLPISPRPVLGQLGLWQVNYTVPGTSFNISYSINAGLSYYVIAYGALNTALCDLAWNSSITYTVKAGYPLNLFIPFNVSGTIVTNSSTLFTTDSAINSTVFQVILNNVSSVPQIEFTTTVDPNQTNPYRGSYSGLQYVGIYTMAAYANRVVPCTPNYFVTVVPGDIESTATQFFGVPSTCVAGLNYSFQVRLRDKFGQVIGNASNVLGLTLAAVLGTDFLDFSSSFDSSNSSYTFIFYARIAGAYNVFVNLTAPTRIPQLGQPPYLTVVPGEPYAPNSVANPPSTQNAGSSTSFYVSLYDSSGVNSSTSNLCTNFNSTKWNLSVTVGGVTPSLLTISSSSTDGRFYVTYTPILAGLNVPINITLLSNGINAGVILLTNVRINAGPAVVPPSKVAQGNATVAGNAASIIFSAYDQYGNPVLGAALSSYITGVDGVKFPVVTPLGNGNYSIALSGTDTRRAGSYVWTIQVNSQPLNVSASPLVIIPGPVDWTQLVIPSLTGVAVGIPASTTVQLQDQFGNNITQSSASGAQAVMQQPAIFCASTGESQQNISDVSASFSNITVTALSNGRLQISFIPKVRGLFRLALFSGGQEAPCQDSAIFAVSAGPVSAPNSSLTITTNTTADPSSRKTARIVFLDAFGNNVDDFTCRFLGNIYFGNHSYGSPAINPAPNWIAPSWSVSCQIEGGFFAYYVTFEASLAGNFLSVLVLQDGGVYDVISSPMPLVVMPGITADFAVPTNSDGTLINVTSAPRATYSAYFDLVAVDNEANVIMQTSVHYFEITCRLFDASGVALYSFQPSVTPQYGLQRATFFSTWAGLFQCETKLYRVPNTYVVTKIFSLKINPAVCLQFQCPDGSCTSAYSNCAPAPPCSGTTPVQCSSDGSCRASSIACPCPEGTTKCPAGHCVAADNLCPPLVSCKNGTCPTGECSTATFPCPSLTVCPPGFMICSDTLTCVLNASMCPAPASCSGTLKYACAQGNCVSSFSDCPSRATCPTDTVLCFDGTCATSSSQCPSIYACPQTKPFRCSDASCVTKQADCPSQTTCPSGFRMCWNGACASSIGACDPITTCPSGTLRCSTGDCAVNEYMCPTQQSCPSGAVLCPDGACVSSVGQCSIGFGCPSGFLTCPTGSCIQSKNVSCPTQSSCPSETPVLCTDGQCVTSADNCTVPLLCPVTNPVRCPDGSCRGVVTNCPTMVTCPPERPVSCQDGYCAADVTQCVASSQLTCPPPLKRCFYGECVPYLSACPPHTTCQIGYDRCSDGTCRLDCGGVVSVGQCAPGTVQCPQSNIGTACAKTLATCPPGIVCPLSTSTRCFDGSCADSLANCPVTTTMPAAPVIPCPDGTWSPDGLCGTPISCPPGSFLCSNYQCLTVQTDCPVSVSCASSTVDVSKPLLCGTVCVADFSSNDCTRSSTACLSDSPFRCPDGVCRSNESLCVSTGVVDAVSRCEPLLACRDGTCAGVCPDADTICKKNSPSTPKACKNGMCVDTLAHCNLANGCPWDRPRRCPESGVCTNDTDTCTEIVCPNGLWQVFGFCVPDQYNEQIRANRCPTSLPELCFDGTCVLSIGECTSATWDTPVGVTPPNTCPFSAPFRCANGYCATASNMCPTIPTDYCVGSTTGTTACADGSCVNSSIFCPIVRPCLATEERGVDGVCRSKSFVEMYGNLVVSSCRGDSPFRCADGLCAKNKDSCLNLTTMCSTEQPTRCDNGACIAGDSSICKSLFAEANGCSSSVPNKCANGACVADLSDCLTPSTGGCDNGVSNCSTISGCPLATPVRCASGICSTAGNCPPTVVCDLGQYVCADGSCQFAYQACPPFPACAEGTTLCSDKTCKASCLGSVCPATSLILCGNGACTNNIKLCPGVVSVELNPGSANGPDSYALACPDPTAPAMCLDGRCRSYQGCMDLANSSGALTSCGNPHTICSDGSCVADEPPPVRPGRDCPIIPRCPSNTYRCGDGSCRSAFVPATSICPLGTLRCEDGQCRSTCLAYDGCGLNAPFHCANRNCATGPEGCTGQPSSQGVAPFSSLSQVGRRLLQSNAIESSPTWCSTNCISQIKAYHMTVTVNPSATPSVDLAIDKSNNVVANVLIPSGSLLSTSNEPITIQFRPVADSLMRSAENAVHPTRQSEFGAQLTYAETLLSVAFECSVPTTVVSPFALNLTYSATIDFTRRPTTQYLGTQTSGPDVCLAYLYLIPALRYSRWTCFPDGVDSRHRAPPNQMPAGVQLDHVRGPISDCGKGSLGKIYGFIESPLRATNVDVASKEKTWAEQNVLVVCMIFLLAAIVLCLCIYCGIRLQRYRKKYLKEAAAVDKMIDERDEMEQYGGTAGTKDDEVEMIPNIMVVQLQNVQDSMSAQNKEQKEKELEQLRLESEERKKHLETLRVDRDNLAAELAKLQSDLNKQQNAPVARPVIEDFSPQDTSGSVTSSTDMPAVSRPSAPATKTAFQSVRPTKKKDL